VQQFDDVSQRLGPSICNTAGVWSSVLTTHMLPQEKEEELQPALLTIDVLKVESYSQPNMEPL